MTTTDTPRSSNGIGDFLSRGGNHGSSPCRGTTLDPSNLPIAERSAYQNGYDAATHDPLRPAVRRVLESGEWSDFSEGDVVVLVKCVLRELAR